jgi:hypothetical protein
MYYITVSTLQNLPFYSLSRSKDIVNMDLQGEYQIIAECCSKTEPLANGPRNMDLGKLYVNMVAVMILELLTFFQKLLNQVQFLFISLFMDIGGTLLAVR